MQKGLGQGRMTRPWRLCSSGVPASSPELEGGGGRRGGRGGGESKEEEQPARAPWCRASPGEGGAGRGSALIDPGISLVEIIQFVHKH